MSEKLLNGKELAEELGRSESYVCAMKRAGYRFKYEALGKTTLRHALESLSGAPDFRAGHYQVDGWQRLPKVLAPTESLAVSASGKSGSLLPNGQ